MSNNHSTYGNRKAPVASNLPKVALINEARSPGGLICATVKSFSAKGSRHLLAMDPGDCRIYCSCPDFQLRHNAKNPTLKDAATCCKHWREFAASIGKEATK